MDVQNLNKNVNEKCEEEIQVKAKVYAKVLSFTSLKVFREVLLLDC